MKIFSYIHRFLPFIVGALGATILYVILRLIALKSLPPFIDEYIYIHWAQMGFFDAAQRLDSIADGKQPLFIWLITLVMNVISNPLIAGKSISLFAGWGTLIGLGTISYLLFKRFSVSIIAMMLYAFFPFALVHDRMAIYDSFVTFFYTWTIVITILFVRKPTLGKAFIFANFMGAALLTKSSTTIFFILIPLFFFLSQQKKQYQHTWLPVILYSLLIIILSYIYQSIIYLSPDAAFIATRNSEFVRPLNELFTSTGILFSLNNILTASGWIITYLTIPVLLIAIFPLVHKKLRNNYSIFLWLATIIPFLVACFVGRNMFPRHIFFLTIPLLVLAAYASTYIFDLFTKQGYKILFVLVLFSGMIISDYTILHNFPTAMIPEIDRYQLANGWPAGYGVREIIKYLQQAQTTQQIVIAAEGAWGSYPKTVSQVYFSHSPNVHLIDFDDHVTNRVPQQIIDSSKDYPVYIFFNKAQTMPSWPMEKVIEVQKGVGTEFMRLYKYSPPTQSAKL